MSLVREQDAGRCGFVVIDPGSNGYHPREALRMPGVVPVSDVMRVSGPHAPTIQKVLPDAYVAESFDQAVAFARQTSAAVATIEGDVLRGPHLVSGGAKAESRGILATRREIKELRERIAADRVGLARCRRRPRASRRFDRRVRGCRSPRFSEEQHRLAISIVGHEAQLARAEDDVARLDRKASVIALERSTPRKSRLRSKRVGPKPRRRSAAPRRRSGPAKKQLGEAQRRLAEAREAVETLAAHAAEARAAHAALVERASAVVSEVARLEEAARELEQRVALRRSELAQTHARRESLLAAIQDGERALDEDVRAIDRLREELRGADEAAATLRPRRRAGRAHQGCAS